MKKIALLLFFFVLYAAFPTQNSTVDAYSYAAQIKYGQELFLPHHLLYNAFGFALKKVFYFVDTLALMKVVNAFVATLCLYLFGLILSTLNKKEDEILAILSFVGVSFGLWRFAVENENYIIPIVFSLIGSYFFLKYLNQQQTKTLLLSGFFAALACLFHQIHVFWWFGLFLGIAYKNLKTSILYVLPALIVPLAYLLVIGFYYHSPLNVNTILHFVFHDFYSGAVDTHFGTKNLILSVISFVRTFVQIHGIIALLLKKSILFIVPLLTLIVTIGIAVYQKDKLIKTKNTDNQVFVKVHGLIFILQFAFAVHSVGNAEFMVMLPFLLLLCITAYYKINLRSLWSLSIGILIWNWTYGIFPNYHYNFYNNQQTVEFIRKNPNALFILENNNEVANLYFYTYNKELTTISSSPANAKNKIQKLRSKIDSCYSVNTKVYTNSIKFPQAMSRATMLGNNDNSTFFKDYQLFALDSVECLMGKSFLYLVEKKITFKK